MMAATVTIVSSSKAAAVALAVALFSVLAAYGAEAAKPGGGWLPAKATWYGSPNGAGPDDNGMYALLCCCRVNKLVCGFACMPSEQQCRA